MGGEVDGLPDGEINEVGFFLGGDDLDLEAELFFCGEDEIAAVGGFADGGGGIGEGDVAVDIFGDALIAGEDVERVGHGALGEVVVDECGGTELGEVLVGGEDFEGEGVGDFDDDHVEGVGADVDGGDAEAMGGGRAARACELGRGCGGRCFGSAIFELFGGRMAVERPRATMAVAIGRRAAEGFEGGAKASTVDGSARHRCDYGERGTQSL